MEEIMNKLTALDFYDIVKVSEEDLELIIENSSTEIADLYGKLKKAKDRLQQAGWLVDIIPLPLSAGGVYWSDYAGDYMRDRHGDEYFNKDVISFTFYLDQDGKQLNINKNIIIHFSVMNRELKEKALNIFYDEIPKNFEWNGRNTKTMIVHYKEGKFEKLDFLKLKDDDEYPRLSFYIDTYCDELDKTPKLKYYKKMVKILKGADYDLSYGLGDIELTVNGIRDEDVYGLYVEITTVLKKYSSKDVPKKKRVNRFSVDFWIDGNNGYTLVKDKRFKKDKGMKTLKEFTKKYKPKK
jgi:hypothetical protein